MWSFVLGIVFVRFTYVVACVSTCFLRDQGRSPPFSSPRPQLCRLRGDTYPLPLGPVLIFSVLFSTTVKDFLVAPSGQAPGLSDGAWSLGPSKRSASHGETGAQGTQAERTADAGHRVCVLCCPCAVGSCVQHSAHQGADALPLPGVVFKGLFCWSHPSGPQKPGPLSGRKLWKSTQLGSMDR